MMNKILLIEDDEIMRENTAEILELAQYEVVTANDGKAGVKLATEIKPDIIICDIMMPGLDGHGVLHILSKDKKTAGIPFIFLTARAEKSDFRKGMELGADDYLTKPFDDTELLNAIEVRLKKHRVLKDSYSQDSQGFHEFIEDAKKVVDFKQIFESFQSKKYKNKHSLFNEGDTPQAIFFIKEGSVKLVKNHGDGKEFIIDVFHQGDFIGAADFFLEQAFGHSGITMEETEVIRLSKDEILPLIMKDVNVAKKFIQILSKSVKDSEEKLMSLAYDTVRKRVANAIIHLAKSNNTLKITREDLANYVGTATETLIRCLGEFKEDNLIVTQGRTIEILDLKALETSKY